MELIIDRKWKKDNYTIGILHVNGIQFSNTLEDKDRGLSKAMSYSEIMQKKVYGETAIPTGTYEVRMTYSSKFANRAWAKKYRGEVPEILDVIGYSGVRIHPFNDASQSLGCIAPGKNTEKGKVTNSTAYYYKLLDNYIVPAINRGEKVTLTIK